MDVETLNMIVSALSKKVNRPRPRAPVHGCMLFVSCVRWHVCCCSEVGGRARTLIRCGHI